MTKMRDGNKESAKELLSTFRTLFAINVSGLFFVATLVLRGDLEVSNRAVFYAGLACSILASIAMIYLFFLMLPKILSEEDNIVELNDVKSVSLVSLGCFVLGYCCLLYGFWK